MDTQGLVRAGWGVVIVLLYAVGAGWWTSREPGWYASLRKPSWQPPDWVFGVIWPVNFLVLGVVSWAVGTGGRPEVGRTFLLLLAGSSAGALTWAALFYRPPHRLPAAAWALTGAAVLTWPLVGTSWSVSWWIGLILLPYAGWLSIAAALAHAYARLNPPR